VGSLTLALRNVLDADATIARTVGVRDLRVGEVNDAVAQKDGENKTAKVARAPGPKADPLASVKIFRALNGSEYKVEKERSAPTANAQPLPTPATPAAPAAPSAPVPLAPGQPEVSAGAFGEPVVKDIDI
jgi:hypothetical protein